MPLNWFRGKKNSIAERDPHRGNARIIQEHDGRFRLLRPGHAAPEGSAFIRVIRAVHLGTDIEIADGRTFTAKMTVGIAHPHSNDELTHEALMRYLQTLAEGDLKALAARIVHEQAAHISGEVCLLENHENECAAHPEWERAHLQQLVAHELEQHGCSLSSWLLAEKDPSVVPKRI